MTVTQPYVGRFAPSPTGQLHIGSMVAAVASFLDARSHGGRWLVRMEDLDPPREVPGAADDILRTLEGFGLVWDGEVMRQSERHERYCDQLDQWRSTGTAFGCVCSRRELSERGGLDVYPGTCRDGIPPNMNPRSFRFRMPHGAPLQWVDRIHGRQSWKREDVGDVILRRADGHWAYHLAVVVDDADQGVTDIVRGADLLGATAAHLALQEMMGVTTPRYAHVPVVVNDQGQKLSKQTLAQPVLVSRATEVLGDVLAHLRQAPVAPDKPDLMLAQATAQWTCPSLTTFHADRGNQTP